MSRYQRTFAATASLLVAISCWPGGVQAEAPSVAFLPWYSNDAALADHSYDQLSQCLLERGGMRLLPKQEAAQAVNALDIDLEQTFGLSDAENQRIGQHLKADYVLSGAFSVLKELTFAGWRKDISANLRLHRSADGAEVGYFQTTTGFSWVTTKKATDPEAMAQMAVDQFCEEVSAMAANGFAVPESEEKEGGVLDL
ncbi:MAG: hypothetical protein ACPG4N_04105 [Gammaproteobacteria bacterium]